MKSNKLLAQGGFTLIELLVTIAIAAILMMVAVPGMTSFKRNAELTSATNSVLAAINAARSEAIKRGMNAMLVPKDGTDWNSGLIAFVDKDSDLQYTAAGDVTIYVAEPLPAQFTITPSNQIETVKATAPYLMFNSSGYSRTRGGSLGVSSSGTLTIARNDLTGDELVTQTRRVVVAATGRVRTCKPDSATDTKCLFNATN